MPSGVGTLRGGGHRNAERGSLCRRRAPDGDEPAPAQREQGRGDAAGGAGRCGHDGVHGRRRRALRCACSGLQFRSRCVPVETGRPAARQFRLPGGVPAAAGKSTVWYAITDGDVGALGREALAQAQAQRCPPAAGARARSLRARGPAALRRTGLSTGASATLMPADSRILREAGPMVATRVRGRAASSRRGPAFGSLFHEHVDRGDAADHQPVEAAGARASQATSRACWSAARSKSMSGRSSGSAPRPLSSEASGRARSGLRVIRTDAVPPSRLSCLPCRPDGVRGQEAARSAMSAAPPASRTSASSMPSSVAPTSVSPSVAFLSRTVRCRRRRRPPLRGTACCPCGRRTRPRGRRSRPQAGPAARARR